MKNKLKIIIPITILIGLIIYITMTPMGALRARVFVSGYPIKAFTLQLREEPYHFYTEENQIGYSLKNPPLEKDTQSELINWIVTKTGIFYTAKYYGWG